MHAPRHFCLGKVLLFHGRLNLPGQDALDCSGREFLVDAFLTEPAING
jgi:hypothetical protein